MNFRSVKLPILALLSISGALQGAQDDLTVAASALHDNLTPIARTRAEKVFDDRSQPDEKRKEALKILLESFDREKKPEKAAALIHNAIAEDLLDGNNVSNIALLAEATLKCGNAKRAIEYAVTATNGTYLPLLRILARAERQNGNISNAVFNYERIAKSATGKIAAENAFEWANALNDGNQPGHALEILQNVAEITNAPAALYLRGELFKKLGRKQKAFDDFLVLSAGTNLFPRLANLSLLQLSELSENPSEAEKFARTAELNAPDEELRVAAGFKRGAILLLRPETLDEGIKLLKALIVKNPGSETSESAQLAVADALLRENRYEQAAAQYRIFLDSYPKSPLLGNVLQNRGIALLRAKKAIDAQHMFRRAAAICESGPMRSQSLMLLGDAHAAAKQFAEAANVYTDIAGQDTDPQTVSAAIFRAGDAFERTGDKNSAIKNFKDVYTRFPNGDFATRAKLRAAKLEAENGMAKNATDIYAEVLADTTNKTIRAEVYMARGRMFYRLFRYSDALQDFAAVAEISETLRDEARFLSILCLYGMGRDEQAKSAAETMIAITPDSERAPDAVLWLGKFFFNRGEWNDAKKYFSEYLSRWPGGKRAQAALFWSAKSAFNACDFSGCIELISDFRGKYPESDWSGEAMMLQANALVELARFDDALLLLQRIAAKNPGKKIAREALLRKSDCLFTMGAGNIARYEEALQTYRQCIKEGNPSEPEILHLNFKIARCLEKSKREEEAIEQYYAGVMLRYESNREKGIPMPDECVSLFVRAGFAASEICAASGALDKALGLLNRIKEAGVPGSKEAEKRIATLRHRKSEGL